MKKLVLLLPTLSLLFLAGCTGDKQDEQGIQAFEKGQYEQAYTYFKKSGDEKWLKKTEKAYEKQLTSDLETLFGNGEFEDAFKTSKKLLEISPTKEVKEVAERVKKEYEMQKELDTYGEFLNRNKSSLTQMIDNWENNQLLYLSGQITYESLVAQAAASHPPTKAIRIEAENIGYKLTNPSLISVNNDFFAYVRDIETYFGETAAGYGGEGVVFETGPADAASRKDMFDRAKAEIETFIYQKGDDGKRLWNYKNPLNF